MFLSTLKDSSLLSSGHAFFIIQFSRFLVAYRNHFEFGDSPLEISVALRPVDDLRRSSC